jgi:hypothetical protein
MRNLTCEPKFHHTPVARDPDDRGLGAGSGFPAGDGGDVLASAARDDGGCDGAAGHGIVRHVGGYDGRDGKRYAVLSVEGARADRLRQVRFHGGLRVRLFRRCSGRRLASVSGPVRSCCAPAQRCPAGRPRPPATRTSTSTSGLNGAFAPFLAARPDPRGIDACRLAARP